MCTQMNFLDSEDSRIYHERDNKIARRQLAQKDLGDPDGRSLLISRSLDESFSVTTGDEDDLNHDQVVFRYYNYYRTGKLSDGREDENSKRKRAVASRILMVSPLRLWKIGRGKSPDDEALPTAQLPSLMCNKMSLSRLSQQTPTPSSQPLAMSTSQP